MSEHLSNLLGREKAITNENDLLAYGYDASGLEGKARAVLFPHNTDEIRKILTYANRTNVPLVVRGLGTNTLGMVVPRNAIVIDMGKFDRIHTVNLKEGWIIVEAGVVLADIQMILRKHGYKFPVNPESASTSTIGGLLATNAIDRYAHKNGRLKDHVENIEIIDGTGKMFEEGNKDFIGLEGTGAIITKAKIKIYPEQETTCDLLSFSQVTELLSELQNKNQDLTVISIEYLNPKLSWMVGLTRKHHLIVEYNSNKGEIKQDAQEELLKKRESTWEMSAKEDYAFIEDCWVPEEKIFEVIQYCEDNKLPLAGHLGIGVMHPFFPPQDKHPFYEFVRELGGTPAGQFGYGLVKKQYVPGMMKQLHNKLKDQYDYNNIIGRGMVNDYA